MNKTSFINEVAKRKRTSSRRAYRAVNDVLDTLRVILSSGESVQIGGFGTFEILTEAEAAPSIRGERIPVFKGGKTLKNVLNTIKEE